MWTFIVARTHHPRNHATHLAHLTLATKFYSPFPPSTSRFDDVATGRPKKFLGKREVPLPLLAASASMRNWRCMTCRMSRWRQCDCGWSFVIRLCQLIIASPSFCYFIKCGCKHRTSFLRSDGFGTMTYDSPTTTSRQEQRTRTQTVGSGTRNTNCR